ncbi:Galactose oxidase/kelch, beta-propeller [Sesbania bispinosa]|nr:Galactose oxidase/kelch, beta-propeller [Sesbania bispinosa]
MERNNHRGGRNVEKKTLYLPQELIMQILLRLPVKSLLRFKCVCKSWLSLISNPHFAISHFELAAAQTHRLLLKTSSTTRSIDLDASLHDDSASRAINLIFSLPKPYFEIFGSCRGFLFLKCYPNLYVWNPSTGVHKQIPLSPNFAPSFYGFGYDSSTDDYLVVLASYATPSADCVCVEFFSLRANTWKEIEGTHLPYSDNSLFSRVGSLLNGAIHWLAWSHDLSEDVMIAFDLREKSFSEIPLPDDFDIEYEYCDLFVLGGYLSLCVLGDDTTDIWMMKQYKVQSSWTNTHVLSSIGSQYRVQFLCTTGSGEIVKTDLKRLVKYNDKGHVLEYRSFIFDHPYYGPQVAMYTESLLSLPGHIEQAEEDFYIYISVVNRDYPINRDYISILYQ